MRAHVAIDATPVILDVTTGIAPIHVGVAPGASSSLSVEYSLTERAAANPETATWFNWTPGTVSAKTAGIISGPITALRFTRASGSSQGLADVVTN
jgi:hypothetical protein